MTEYTIDSFEGCSRALRQSDLRQALYDDASLMMERSLVNLHGGDHRSRRNVEATLFRKNIFMDYEKNVLPRTLTETIAPFLAAGKGDLVDIGYRIMMNLTVDFTGIDRPSYDRARHLLACPLLESRDGGAAVALAVEKIEKPGS